MKATRFANAAASGTLLLLLCLFLATILMHTSSASLAGSQLGRSRAQPARVLAAQAAQPTLIDSSAQLPSADEEFFFRAANRERHAEGLPQYKWNDALAAAARKHAARMASEDELSHQLFGEPSLGKRANQAGARFSSVGENVAIGPQTEEIHTGWMNSPGHRANILSTDFTALGVGVVVKNDQLYAVEDFSRAVENLDLEEQEKKVSRLLTAEGFHVTAQSSEARRICSGESPEHVVPSGPHHNMEILQVETPDLSAFPAQIERSLHASKYRQAAVGACKPQQEPDELARFRIVILLFAALR